MSYHSLQPGFLTGIAYRGVVHEEATCVRIPDPAGDLTCRLFFGVPAGSADWVYVIEVTRQREDGSVVIDATRSAIFLSMETVVGHLLGITRGL